MTRWISGADSIVWIVEGKNNMTRAVDVLIHAPKTFPVFGFFILT